MPPISSAVSVPYCSSTPRCSHGPGLRTAPLIFAGCVSDEGDPRVIATLDLEFIF